MHGKIFLTKYDIFLLHSDLPNDQIVIRDFIYLPLFSIDFNVLVMDFNVYLSATDIGMFLVRLVIVINISLSMP